MYYSKILKRRHFFRPKPRWWLFPSAAVFPIGSYEYVMQHFIHLHAITIVLILFTAMTITGCILVRYVIAYATEDDVGLVPGPHIGIMARARIIPTGLAEKFPVRNALSAIKTAMFRNRRIQVRA